MHRASMCSQSCSHNIGHLRTQVADRLGFVCLFDLIANDDSQEADKSLIIRLIVSAARYEPSCSQIRNTCQPASDNFKSL